MVFCLRAAKQGNIWECGLSVAQCLLLDHSAVLSGVIVAALQMRSDCPNSSLPILPAHRIRVIQTPLGKTSEKLYLNLRSSRSEPVTPETSGLEGEFQESPMKSTCLPRFLRQLAVCLSVFGTATALAQTRPADSAASYIKRGSWWFAQGDLDRAITDFDMAIAFDPNAAAAYYNRGCVRQAKGDGDRALADYHRAIEINPRHGAAYNNSCGIYFVLGRLDEAMAACNRALRLILATPVPTAIAELPARKGRAWRGSCRLQHCHQTRPAICSRLHRARYGSASKRRPGWGTHGPQCFHRAQSPAGNGVLQSR